MKSPGRLTRNLVEAAAILGVDEKSLRNHLTDTSLVIGGGRTLTVIRIGRRLLVPVAELERVLGQRVAS